MKLLCLLEKYVHLGIFSKNARYAGFHHDRELGVIRQYEQLFTEYQELWNECYQIRKDIFPNRFLGELHGWNGIRSERKNIG